MNYAPMKHLFGIEELSREQLCDILDLGETIATIGKSQGTTGGIPRIDALKGRMVCTLFFEDSTRTRLSFEKAARSSGAEVMSFAAKASSVNKGESMRDTVETLAAMGPDAFVVRHRAAGVPQQIANWCDASVVNAGDGAHEHPTQALLDCLSLRRAFNRKDFAGLRIAIVGDIEHSRVARSALWSMSKLGADMTIVGPRTLLPTDCSALPCSVESNLDEVIPKVDVIYTIRPQQERISEALLPSMREYISRYSLTHERFKRLDSHVLVLEAGPLLRGVQMESVVADDERCLKNAQVNNGVLIRMAVLCHLLQGRVDG